jgi:hypothetical protein
MRIRRRPHSDPVLVADSEFGLARALWNSGGDQRRARSLATTALDTLKRRAEVNANVQSKRGLLLAAHNTERAQSVSSDTVLACEFA